MAFANVNNATVVPTLMKEFLPPFMLGLVFMGAIAAIHSTAAPYIGTGGSILLRDVYWRYIRNQQRQPCRADLDEPGLGHRPDHRWHLTVGMTSKAALVILGALATAFGFVMYVLLVGVIWGFKFPGSVRCSVCSPAWSSVFLTYNVWPNPLSMHCAFWGTAAACSWPISAAASGIKDNEETIKRQAEVRAFLDDIDEPSRNRQAVAQLS
jgi:SSS family solute:Na+ symporter